MEACVHVLTAIVLFEFGNPKSDRGFTRTRELDSHYFRPSMDSVFEVSPFLVQRTSREVCKKLLEMLWGVVYIVLVARAWEQPVPGHLD